MVPKVILCISIKVLTWLLSLNYPLRIQPSKAHFKSSPITCHIGTQSNTYCVDNKATIRHISTKEIRVITTPLIHMKQITSLSYNIQVYTYYEDRSEAKHISFFTSDLVLPF